MKKHYRKENDCLNCGTVLEGKFCHNCGQENLQIKESFGHMMNHAISDYFHFDHQFFHTLKPLFFKPGKLTIEYMAGRRAQFLHPVKMYIFISIVYFLILFQTGHQMVNINTSNDDPKTTQRVIDSIQKDHNIPVFAKRAIIDDLRKHTHSPTSSTEDKSIVIDDGSASFLSPSGKDSTYAAYLLSQQKLPANKRDGFIERYYNEKAYAYKIKYGARTKEVILDEFKHNIPKMMFLLLPFCALILMVAFRKNKKYYVEHLIYSFHLHCFIFLFMAIIMLLQWIIPVDAISQILGLLATITVIWYIYRSLKVVYGRSRWRTVSKLIGLSLMYMLGFVICTSMAFIITALMAA